MRTQIIQKLSEITEEEQELLQGNGEIDKGLYQSEPLEEPAPGSYVIDSKKLLDAGKLITIRKHTRFAHFPAHTHNYVEVIYMCEGQTHHIINGKDVYLKKGELLFLNQNSIQEIYPATEQDVAVNFIVLPEFFDRALHMMNPTQNKRSISQFTMGLLLLELMNCADSVAVDSGTESQKLMLQVLQSER